MRARNPKAGGTEAVPSSEEDLRQTFISKARQVLPPITREVVEALNLHDDPAGVETVGHALARAFTEGAALGATEVVAQAAERGTVIELHWLGGSERDGA